MLQQHVEAQDKQTKGLLEQDVSGQTINTNNVLGKFAAATKKQFAIQDSSIDTLETEGTSCKANNNEMQKTLLAIQEEQTRQAQALLLADKQGAITREEVNKDQFDRPPNLEIIEMRSPKFVSKSAI